MTIRTAASPGADFWPRRRATVDEHAREVSGLLRTTLERTDSETVALADALGRVSASDVLSPVDLPLFRNSQMDGFAVRSADLTTIPAALPVVGDQPAGAGIPDPLTPGTARRIMTGAIVPDGADCIVPVEDTDADFGGDGRARAVGSGADHVTIRAARVPGEFVRERGSDVHAGDLLAPAGIRLAPRHLAALAAAGLDSVPVRRRLRIGIVTTGAELVAGAGPASGAEPPDGHIFDANAVALAGLVREDGAEVVYAGASSDDPAELVSRLDDAVRRGAEAIITSGGISAGAFEVVREVLEPEDGRIGTVAMQPGGPQGLARYRGTPVVAFPGNPVSTQISYAVFLRPLLRADAGLPRIEPRDLPLAAPLTSVAAKRQFLRGRVSSAFDARSSTVAVVSGASSHLVAGMARADVLIDVPEEITALPAGAIVRVWPL
jgi:molybdopterin molybdotransferase